MQTRRSRNRAGRAATFVALLCLMTSPAHAESGPFAGMAGVWSGGGRIDMSNGPSERIRCRARYTIGAADTVMRQHLRCASASYNINVETYVAYRGGAISGTWSETTRNVSGQLTGTARRGRIVAQVYGGAFTANLTLVTTGNSQRVTIAPQSGDVRGVVVTLHRG
jgi:hypothetical protein